MKRRPKSARIRSSVPKTPNPQPWHFRLYIAGQTPRSLCAIVNLRRLCEAHLPERHVIEVVDLLQSPGLGRKDQVVALPTLVRKQPAPPKRLIGDLSNTARVLASMELTPSPLFP